MTAGALTCHESIETIDAVEISREVIDAAPLFSDYTHDAVHNPKINLIRQDGRNHLLLTDRTYDLIVSEPSNPWVAGVAYLFTCEFYELCKRRLRDDGVVLTWMHTYTVDPEDFRRIVHSVVSVMPHVTLWTNRSDFMMIASKKPFDVKLTDWLRRFDAPAVRADLHRLGYDSPAHLLGLYLAGPAALQRWTADAPLHHDDHPTVQYSGARALLRGFDLQTGIALTAFGLADEQLPALIAPDPAVPEHAAIFEDSRRMQAARRLIHESEQAALNDRPLEAAQLALDAYRTFPEDPYAREVLHDTYLALEQGAWDRPDWARLAQTIKANLPPPPLYTVPSSR
jgi:spermidine synthase